LDGLATDERFGFKVVEVEVHDGLAAVYFVTKADDALRYRVNYALDDPLIGVMTGEPCETLKEWTAEVFIDLDERISTGELSKARRRHLEVGLVELTWQ
jgi:hypothetical protein